MHFGCCVLQQGDRRPWLKSQNSDAHFPATRMGDAGADAFTLAAIFGWSDIRMAMRYTHEMEDAKRRAVEAIAVGRKRNAIETPAIPVSRDHGVTNEKPAASQIAVSG